VIATPSKAGQLTDQNATRTQLRSRHWVPSRRRWILGPVALGACAATLLPVSGVGTAYGAADTCPGSSFPNQTYIQSVNWGVTLDQYQQPSLAVFVTPWGKSNASNHTTAAFKEAVAKAGGLPTNPDGSSTYSTMYHQFQCHAVFVPGKRPWNLEPWRPDGDISFQFKNLCNATPGGYPDSVPGVGVGPPSPAGSALAQAFQNAVEAGGNPPAMGQPVEPVHDSGPGCLQRYKGGKRAGFHSAVVMSPRCGEATVSCNTGSPDACWVGDYFWAYYRNRFGSDTTTIGYPVNNSHRWGSGWAQDFRYGDLGRTITMRRDGQTTVRIVRGPFRSEYLNLGGAPGFLGYPTSGSYSWNGGLRQHFEGGSLIWDQAHGTRLLTE
jgi:hypothetical protein